MCPSSPWVFVLAISSQLASSLFPISAFLHLKVGLMLSLATQRNNDRPLPIFAVGGDTFAAEKLFPIAGQLAERYVVHTAAHSHLGGTVVHNPQSEVTWQEAGSLILAANGVCNLGDWAKFRGREKNYICQTIETGKVSLINSNAGVKNITSCVLLNSSVWTYWCHITRKQKDQLLLRTLIDVFGIPFLTDARDESEAEEISSKMIGNAAHAKETKTCDEFSVPDKQLREFLMIINAREMSFSESALELIKNYFIASRRNRPNCLPMGAIKTISLLSEAFSRLSLRTEILPQDVIPVIYFYEEAISLLFGESCTSFRRSDWDQQEPIFVFMDEQLEKFCSWLKEYIRISVPSL